MHVCVRRRSVCLPVWGSPGKERLPAAASEVTRCEGVRAHTQTHTHTHTEGFPQSRAKAERGKDQCEVLGNKQH